MEGNENSVRLKNALQGGHCRPSVAAGCIKDRTYTLAMTSRHQPEPSCIENSALRR